MGHFCRFCGRVRANEQFSGKGHKIHVCKRCQRLPESKRQAIEAEDDIFGFMQQSHISSKNTARLEQLAKSKQPRIARLAAICSGGSADYAVQAEKAENPCPEGSQSPARAE